jgi:hypothetical protein
VPELGLFAAGRGDRPRWPLARESAPSTAWTLGSLTVLNRLCRELDIQVYAFLVSALLGISFRFSAWISSWIFSTRIRFVCKTGIESNEEGGGKSAGEEFS